MFTNLTTSTKLLLLSGMCIISLCVASYGWISEKQIAIEFVRKELVGAQYLKVLEAVYSGILNEGSNSAEPADVLGRLAAAEAVAVGSLNSADDEQKLAEAIRKLSTERTGIGKSALTVDALAKARNFAAQVGDDSGLALDPDLNSYYVQKILVKGLPTLRLQLGELQSLQWAKRTPDPIADDDPRIRHLLLVGMIRATIEEIERDATSAYGGQANGSLAQGFATSTKSMIVVVDKYLEAANSAPTPASLVPSYRAALDAILGTWTVAQAELEKLLNKRKSDLHAKLLASLLLIGSVASLVLLLIALTHRQIAGPLKQLEKFAGSVSETKDYGLRVALDRKDEIGQLALAFNTMLEELSLARERETSEQTRTAAMQLELARAARFTAMGELAASIAHEINQPLAAIVNNASAGLRWLNNRPPNIDEVRLVLGRLVNDGGRCSEIITGIRSMLKKGDENKSELDLNELIRSVMRLVQGQIEGHGVLMQLALADDLPKVVADRVQLQQVILNLVVNATEAMTCVAGRERVLYVRSERHQDDGALIAVEDSGIGIHPETSARIFDAFFTTKNEGMGMGLSICQSIVQAHGGLIKVSPATPHGSVFCIILPGDRAAVAP